MPTRDPISEAGRRLTDGDLREPDCARQLLRSLANARPTPQRGPAGLTDADLAALSRAGTRGTCAVGAPVFEPKFAPAEPLLIVLLRGAVTAGRRIRGRRVVTDVLARGSLLPTQALVVALTPVEILVVPAEAFRSHVERHPATALAVFRALQQRLEAAEVERAAAAQLDTMERVACVILNLARGFGRAGADGVAIDLPLTQEDLAGLACASGKATATALGRLRERGAVATARRRIVIRDPRALEALARGATTYQAAASRPNACGRSARERMSSFE